MLKKYLVLSLGLLVIAALFIMFPTVSQAQQGDSENFIFVNYIGQELILDLDDIIYVVPGTDTHPEGGRLALQLAVGEHKYAANVPGVSTGSAGEFTIEPGGFVAKAAIVKRADVVVDRNGVVIGPAEDYVDLFDFNPFAPPLEKAPVVDTWQPSAPAPEMGSIAWINYFGRDELTVDLGGQIYKVPPQVNDIPGRLQIDLAPGDYRYTVSVPNGSLNGEITVVAGQVTGIYISAELPEPRKYDPGDDYEFLPPVTLRLGEENLTGVTGAAVPEAAPAVLPPTGGELAPARLEATTRAEGLLLKNFAGDTLTFTINNQTYLVPDRAEQVLNLPPGQFSYTASVPFAAAGGILNITPGQGVELSIAINVNHDQLNLYQN